MNLGDLFLDINISTLFIIFTILSNSFFVYLTICRVHSTYHAFTKILKENGVRGLWKGSIPNVQRAALVNLGDLTTYDTAKRLILKNTTLTDSHTTHVLARLVSKKNVYYY